MPQMGIFNAKNIGKPGIHLLILEDADRITDRE